LDKSFVVDHQSSFDPPYQLLYVGYLEPWKGVTKLVPLVGQLRNRGVDVELTVVGDGSCLEEMKAQSQRRNLNQWITFCGRVPNYELPETYANHDIFVYPGVWEEPLGRVYLEALASGTPILSTEYGTIDKVIGAGGETARPSVESLADQLQQMISENLEAYSSRAAKQAGRFRADNVIPEMEELYRAAIERKERRTRGQPN
jgi:glycosyltransferase involved in cell wall biosynthesis